VFVVSGSALSSNRLICSMALSFFTGAVYTTYMWYTR
jgi:hypothetical protein